MAKKKASRLGEAIRKRALSYPETREDFPWGESAFKVKHEGFRAVAPKRVVAGLPDPPRLP